MEDLFDLTARWTFNGVAPTASEPCADFDDFRVGVTYAGGWFADVAPCEAGVIQYPRVPTSATTISARAYQRDSIVGSADVERAGATDVTLDIVLP